VIVQFRAARHSRNHPHRVADVPRPVVAARPGRSVQRRQPVRERPVSTPSEELLIRPRTEWRSQFTARVLPAESHAAAGSSEGERRNALYASVPAVWNRWWPGRSRSG
jgi:hypothetical protein